MIIVTDSTGLIKRVGDALLKITGHTMNDLSGREVSYLLKEFDGKSFLKTKTGVEIDVICSTIPLTQSNHANCCSIYEIELTDSGEMASTYGKKNHNLTKAILESIDHPLIVVNTKNYRLEYANKKALELKKEGDVTCYALTHKRNSPCQDTEHPCPLKEVMRTGKSFSTIHFHYDKDGEKGVYEVHGHPIFNDEGEINFMVEYSIPIDKRTLSYDMLEANELKFRNLFHNLNDAVTVVHIPEDSDEKLTFLEVNQAALDRFGYDKATFLSLKFTDLFSPIFRLKASKTLRDLPLGKEAVFEVEEMMQDGHRIPVELMVHIIEFKGNKAALIISRDIRDRKIHERKREELSIQLIQSSKLASIGSLASSVAHELNNPLTAIIGFSQAMLANENSETSKKLDIPALNQKILKASERMKKIIDQLRKFARGSKQDDWKPTDVNDSISSALIILEQHLSVSDIKLTLNFGEHLPDVYGDTNQLESVFQNLITNSYDAFESVVQPQGRMITFTTEAVEGGVKVTYTDNAGGIPKKVERNIFDPFFTTKDPGKGTGLGMSISREIVEKHKGHIRLINRPGDGVTFEIFLPSDRRKKMRLEERTHDVEVATAEKSLSKTGRILVVDDEEDILDVMSLFLEEYYDLTLCKDPEKALNVIRDGQCDLIITDLKMPTISGQDVMYTVKSCGLDIPVLLMTGNASEDPEVVAALKFGGKDIITKPFSGPDEIISKIKKHLK